MVNCIKSAFMKHRYVILSATTMLMTVQMWWAFRDFVPVEYESLMAMILCTTILVWIGIVGLIGIVAPVDYHTVMRYRYLIMSILVLAIADWILGLQWHILLVYVCIASAISITVRGEHMSILYALLVLFPLILLGWIGLSSMFLTTTYGPLYWAITALSLMTVGMIIAPVVLRSRAVSMAQKPLFSWTLGAYLIALLILIWLFSGVAEFALAMYGILVPALPFLLLLSLRMKELLGRIGHPYRNIVSSGIALWAMIAIVGWYWTGAVPDGLDAFAGQERVDALNTMRQAHCEDAISNPTPTRVVKDDSGGFRVLGYTWWRFPSRAPSCGPYRQGNRW